jgi:hypothetical protein
MRTRQQAESREGLAKTGSERRPGLRIGGIGYWLTACILISTLAAGCGGGKKKGGVSRLSPRSTPYLTGVPVPAGFRLADEWSEDHQSGGVRFARHRYVGHADLFSVRDFYLDQMPLAGWNKVSKQNIKGTISIRFEKPTEVCTVQLERSGMFDEVTVTVIVKPFQRATKQPPKRRMP